MSIRELIHAELELLPETELGELYELIKSRSQKYRDIDDDLGSLLNRCQVSTGLADLSEQHDHYLHGTPKKEFESGQS